MTTSTAFVFPGQGSQAPKMLADYYQQSSVFKETFAEASEALRLDLWDLIANGDQEALSLTANTQPVLLVSSVAIYRVYQSLCDARPALMSGHSLGEFSALTAAGSIALPDAVRLVRRRGELMQAAVPAGVGAMGAVIGLDDQVIVDTCKQVAGDTGLVVEAVNFNAPGQVVIAGHKEGVAAAETALKALGAKRVMPLPVSAPFHTSLMQAAAQDLGESLGVIDILTPAVGVVHNVSAATESDPTLIRELLVKQLYSPVRWTQCVQSMAALGVECLVECGPGKVLSGLGKRIDKNLASVSLSSYEALEAYAEEVNA
ncbi:MAG: ACP S-malonyltransferase [Halieaceae bacterium]|jgi:[acyl-carrier-protein] S-malonyltransferase|nr:ACP S-malonyltransferase [Halieaceae bacterium]